MLVKSRHDKAIVPLLSRLFLIAIFVLLGGCAQLLADYRNEQSKSEEIEIANFAKSNDDLNRAVGGIKEIHVGLSHTRHMERLPWRYKLSVVGEGLFDVAIDVSRVSGTAKFDVACVIRYAPRAQDPLDVSGMCNRPRTRP